MKRSPGLAIPFLLAACLACATGATVEFDPQEDFSGYRSWEWLPRAAETGKGRQPGDPELEALIRGSIERELDARGYLRATADPPDFYVTYHVQTTREVKVSTEAPADQTLSSHHQSPSYVITKSERVVRIYERGTLAIDLAEGRDRQLVWRGTETRRARQSFKPEVEAAVAEILDRFPPAPRP
jgi:hypothetical protein